MLHRRLFFVRSALDVSSKMRYDPSTSAQPSRCMLAAIACRFFSTFMTIRIIAVVVSSQAIIRLHLFLPVFVRRSSVCLWWWIHSNHIPERIRVLMIISLSFCSLFVGLFILSRLERLKRVVQGNILRRPVNGFDGMLGAVLVTRSDH